jgi:hypothetical protein
MDFLVPQSDAGWAHRRGVLERAVTDPSARTGIDSGKLYAPFRYGDAAHPMVGAIIPDVAVDGRRLRETARRGLLVLSNRPVDVPTEGPVTVVPQTLGPDDEVWLIRPDAHVAAIGTAAEVAAAVRTQWG